MFLELFFCIPATVRHRRGLGVDNVSLTSMSFCRIFANDTLIGPLLPTAKQFEQVRFILSWGRSSIFRFRC